MEWYFALAIIAAGFAAGFINTLAGSGSLITLSLLIFLGIPATVANGTNRVGVLFQNMVAVFSFRQQEVLDTRHGLILAVPAIIGSLLGAQIAVNLNEELLRRAIGVVMVIMLVVILIRPSRWLQGTAGEIPNRPTLAQIITLFAIGIYGGFIQAGVGIFMLAALVLSIGYDLVRANAIKVLINFCFTFFALFVFIYNDQVWWGVGILLAIGNAGGGWLAAHMAVERGAVFVRWVLIAVVAVSALQLLGIIDFVLGLF